MSLESTLEPWAKYVHHALVTGHRLLWQDRLKALFQPGTNLKIQELCIAVSLHSDVHATALLRFLNSAHEVLVKNTAQRLYTRKGDSHLKSTNSRDLPIESPELKRIKLYKLSLYHSRRYLALQASSLRSKWWYRYNPYQRTLKNW